jgi:uncharacterized caspase-like protein
VPADATRADLDRLRAARQQGMPPGRLDSLISSAELSAHLKRVPGRRILVVDTCHAGSADGRANPYTLAKRSAAAEVAVLAAASGEESNEDEDESPHGAFTKAFLEAIDPRGDRDRDGQVTLLEAFEYVGPRVAGIAQRLSRKHGVPITQTPTLTAIDSLRRSILAVR